MALAAKKCSYEIARASSEQKNSALKAIMKLLERDERLILEANAEDIQEAKKSGLSEAMIDRLSLQGNRIKGMIKDIDHVIKLKDPIGECFEEQMIGELKVKKCRTPIGVLGVIYESRPNVTIDVAALTVKTGNCAILRGGSETLRTNKVLVKVIQEALNEVGLPEKAIQLVSSSDRAEVQKMLRLYESIDLIIPRGGAALHKYCRENSSIPVITGGIGVCHLFVDESAELQKSLEVIINAKTQRPTVCNALDTLLIHEKMADRFVPMVVEGLREKGVELHLDDNSWNLVSEKKEGCVQAQEGDWDTEWMKLTLGVKVVKGVEEAIEHIRLHSTAHSDGILTESQEHAELFVREVDSAAVYVNASTRFTDGSQLGLGSEVAISTQKLHARGPMGLRELTSYKWIIHGKYSVRK